MTHKPPHDRRLGLVGVALTKAKLSRIDGKALDEVRNELEPMLVQSGYLEDAPFWWVTVAVRYGLKNDDVPRYQAINRKYGDLPLAIEIDTHRIIGRQLDDVKTVFREAVLKALIHAGEKYKRPTERLRAVLESKG